MGDTEEQKEIERICNEGVATIFQYYVEGLYALIAIP